MLRSQSRSQGVFSSFVAVSLTFFLLSGAGIAAGLWPDPPPSNLTWMGAESSAYGWAFAREIDCGPCQCGPPSSGANGSSANSGEALASVSYYIAQALDSVDNDGLIRAPVPCLSRIKVTSAKSEISITARVARVCRYCRNKYIGLSPTAFASLEPSSNSTPTSEHEVWWSIDNLRSAGEGNSAPAPRGQEDEEENVRALKADIESGTKLSRLKNSLKINAECDLPAEEARQNLLKSLGNNYTYLFEEEDPLLLGHMIERYRLDRSNQPPGTFCDVFQGIVCNQRRKCQCLSTMRPVAVLSSPGCLDIDDGDGFVCVLYLEEEECPPLLDVCQLTRFGHSSCAPTVRKNMPSTSTPTELLYRILRFPLVEEAEGSPDCLCMDTVTFRGFVSVSQLDLVALHKFSAANTLGFGSPCDPGAEQLRGASWRQLRGMNRQLDPSFFSPGLSNLLMNELSVRSDLYFRLASLTASNFTFCKTYEHLACNASGVCDCYTNSTEHMELVREGGACVLTEGSICDPAFWDGRFEKFIDEYEEDAPRPVCQGGLPCVDMATGELCPRNESFVSVSFKYKLFPFLHPRFKEQDPEAFKLTMEEYCRCHKPFELPEKAEAETQVWLFVMAACLSALTLVLVGTVVRYQHTLRLAKKEERIFLRGDPKFSEDDHVSDVDGAVRAQYLRYDDEKYEIDPNNLEYDRETTERLGYGGFGVVVPGILRKDGVETEVAIKSCKNASDRIDIRSLRVEIKILSYVGQHPNVVDFIGAVAADAGVPKLILELCKHGSLDTLLWKNASRFLDQRVQGKFDPTFRGEVMPGYSPNWIFCSTNLVCWSYQIANGMEFLGTKDVVHGDLFIKNVLIASNGVAKITDFGLARQFGFDGKRYIRAHDGPLPLFKFLPPEVQTGLGKFSPAFDVWTFGVLLWEMFSLGKAPDCERSAEELRQPVYATKAVHAISRRCWTVKLNQRIGFGELKEQIRRLLGGPVDPLARTDLSTNLPPNGMRAFTIQE